eukprot:566802-Amphidinium_carterae.1
MFEGSQVTWCLKGVAQRRLRLQILTPAPVIEVHGRTAASASSRTAEAKSNCQNLKASSQSVAHNWQAPDVFPKNTYFFAENVMGRVVAASEDDLLDIANRRKPCKRPSRCGAPVQECKNLHH